MTDVPMLLAPLNRALEPWLRLGWANPLGFGPGIVLLEVPGRRTGILRSLPLVGSEIGNRILVATVRPGSQWLRNLAAAGRGRLWLRGCVRRAELEAMLPALAPGAPAIAILRLDQPGEAADLTAATTSAVG